MMDDFESSFNEQDWTELLTDCVHHAVAADDADSFLQWVRREVGQRHPNALPAMLLENEPEAALTLLGRVIWSAVPRPEHGYRPQPLPKPERNAPCVCGSAKKYKQCCQRLPAPPTLDSEQIWELALDAFSPQQLKQALAAKVVPPVALGEIARREMATAGPRRAVELLEEVFQGPLKRLDLRYGLALTTLVDAYQELGLEQERRELLHRVTREARKDLAAEAWQRLAGIAADDGDFAAAGKAIEQAIRLDPDDPTLPFMEVSVLVQAGELLHAQQRAQYWLARWRRSGEATDELIELLEELAQDPTAAIIKAGAEDMPLMGDLWLEDWVESIEPRPLPAYRLEPAGSADEYAIQEPVGIAQLGRAWLEACEAVDAPDRLQEFLEQHPQAGDSLLVLDDLGEMIERGDFWLDEYLEQDLSLRLAQRGRAIVEAALRQAPAAVRLPWAILDNRSALGLLMRECLAYEAHSPQRRAGLERLLELNPNDNAGMRALLMNELLGAGMDAQALALAERYPDDLLVELLYGRVLALYRSGRRDEAEAALLAAHQRFPHVRRYLSFKRVAQPEVAPYSFTVGGEDQAWLYREDMRAVWASVPGLLEWVRKKTSAPG